MVDALVLGERQRVVRAVHRRARRVDEMRDARVAAALEHVAERVDVVAHVGVRDAISEWRTPGCAARCTHVREAAVAKQARGRVARRRGRRARTRSPARLRASASARLLQRDVVVRIEVVDARHARAARRAARCARVHADEAGGAGDEDVCIARGASRSRAVERAQLGVLEEARERADRDVREARPRRRGSRACTT